MGYNIGIGEHVKVKENITDDDYTYTSHCVKPEDGGPKDGTPTSGENARWPSYTGWSEFMDDIKIPREMIIDEHPGFVSITQEHIDLINNIDIKTLEAYNQERFIWFGYWVRWAFKNCKDPVIVNS
jgi:hypothetical protein